MAAPSCFVTTYLRNLENEEDQDSEQYPPMFYKNGLEMADFFIAQAPRPVILLGQKNDFFDFRGTVETFKEVQQVYRLLGAEKNVSMYIGPHSHGYFKENREAMYGFFNQHTGLRCTSKEPKILREKDTSLHCTKKGQVYYIKAKDVFSFTRENADQLASKRKALSGPSLKRQVSMLLGYTRPKRVPVYRCLKERVFEKCILSRLLVETEPGIQALLYRSDPIATYHLPVPGKQKKAIVYIPHVSLRDDLKTSKVAQWIHTLSPDFFLEPRGCGESIPLGCKSKSYFHPYNSDYMYGGWGLMTGKSYLGQKVFDITSVLCLLHAHGYKRIHLVGQGIGSIAVAFSALLSDHVTCVTLINYLRSYHELTQVPAFLWPLSHFPRGILKYCDLPDIYEYIRKEKQLILKTPWDCLMRPLRKK
jgi:hypothetical protein